MFHRFRLLVCVGLALLAAPALSGAYGEADQSSIDVSLVRLIAAPEGFQGKRVRVSGVLHMELREDALYLSKEHREAFITKNALALYFDPQRIGATSDTLAGLSGKYVIVEGVFDGRKKGNMSQYAASLDAVNRVDPLE